MPGFRPLDDAEIATLQKLSDKVYAVLDKKHRLALDDYTNAETGMHKKINNILRGGVDDDKQTIMTKYVSCIDSAIKKFKNPFSVIVYCGTGAEYYKNWDVGTVKTKNEYLSTSVDVKIAGDFFKDKEDNGEEPLMLEIFIHEGVCGIYVGENTAFEENEKEFLLGRGLRYKVLERCGNILKLEVLS